MSVEQEVVALTKATTDLLEVVTEKRAALDGAVATAKASEDAAAASSASAKVAEVSAKKSEGAASASAKAADDAAMRASKISGLDDVAAAVSMAALPFPDVWLPLSDSLNMLAGYGEEVKVGEHVVARKASFSRNSTATYVGKDGQRKTAAVNEPRFEKEGLLIEGQSTNLINFSIPVLNGKWTTSKNGTGVEPAVTPNYGVAPDGTDTASRVVMARGGGTTPSDLSFLTVTGVTTKVGHPLTLSGWIRSNTSSEYKLMVSHNGSGQELVAVTGTWQRFSTTIASAEDASRFPRFSLRGGDGTSEMADFLLWGVQLEELPSATSYIPTNGAAVTRAGEYLSIPVAGNLPTSELTFCVNVADYNAATESHRAVVIAPELSASSERFYLAIGMDGAVTLVVGDKTTRAAAIKRPGSPVGLAISATGKFKLFYNGEIQSSGSFGGPIKLRDNFTIGAYASGNPRGHINGHIRDLRIWHTFLADEQIKAIK